jgi:hypothetical protein
MADGDPILIGTNANFSSTPLSETQLQGNVAPTLATRNVFSARNVGFGDGIYGEANQGGTGVRGLSFRGSGVDGSNSGPAPGVRGSSFSGPGVQGTNSSNWFGVEGISTSGIGVQGTSGALQLQGVGVRGTSEAFSGIGVVGIGRRTSDAIGVYGRGLFGSAKGGVFDGGITVFNGPKSFKIDHPLDPENRYLVHTCVESSEMKNVYDGVAHLDEDGGAWVELPEWFEPLNGDFRYQLTSVGESAPDLHVAEEVSENRFKIGGGKAGTKVCWQVTGSRKDRSAAAHPFEVEQEKREEERGRYLEPSLYDAPEEQRVMIGPVTEAVEAEQRPPQPSGIDFARMEEERLRQRTMQQPTQSQPPQFFPPQPQPSMVPPSFDFARLEEHRRQIDRVMWLVEEQRRQLEELRRRVERREEGPPEST